MELVSKSSRMVLPRKESRLLLQTCQKVLDYLDQERSRGLTPTIQKKLDCGLILTGESVQAKIATLQIGFAPGIFEIWRSALGPIELYYTNPYGIEIAYERDVWGFWVDERRLRLSLSSKEPYEMARLEIKGGSNGLEVSMSGQPASMLVAAPVVPATSHLVLNQGNDRVLAKPSRDEIRSRLLGSLG